MPQIAHVKNSKSALNNSDVITKKLQEEIAEGTYKIVDRPATIISALHAIPKPDGGIRLIHDCSLPPGKSVNDYATNDDFSFQTVREALEKIGPHWFLAKVDLRAAYRSVHLHESNWQYTGLQWRFGKADKLTNLVDLRLPFGARKSCSIFNRITQAVRRMMERRGFKVVIVYLDDFLIAGETFEACAHALRTLITLLRSLGFHIN